MRSSLLFENNARKTMQVINVNAIGNARLCNQAGFASFAKKKKKKKKKKGSSSFKPPEDRLRPCTIVLGDAHGTCIALKILPGPWRDWLTEKIKIGAGKKKQTFEITHLEAHPDDSPRPSAQQAGF
jgi:hypothetical protein